jgi:hypothetical protein
VGPVFYRPGSTPPATAGLDVNEPADRVPLFGTWRRAYLAVVIIFILEVTFFYFVSRYFS